MIMYFRSSRWLPIIVGVALASLVQLAWGTNSPPTSKIDVTPLSRPIVLGEAAGWPGVRYGFEPFTNVTASNAPVDRFLVETNIVNCPDTDPDSPGELNPEITNYTNIITIDPRTGNQVQTNTPPLPSPTSSGNNPGYSEYTENLGSNNIISETQDWQACGEDNATNLSGTVYTTLITPYTPTQFTNNVVSWLAPFSNNFVANVNGSTNKYSQPDELIYNLFKLQYKLQVNAESNAVVTWDEMFTPEDTNLPIQHNIKLWTNTAGTTNTPVYVINPLNYTNASGVKTSQFGIYQIVGYGLVPDFNRDGSIDEKDAGKVTTNNPFRFWIDDSNERGDIASGGNDIPGTGSNNTLGNVNGREDLINYFPLYLDIAQLVTLYSPYNYTYQLSQADGAVNFVYTDLKPIQAGGFLTNSSTTSTLNDTTANLAYATTEHVTAAGTSLDYNWLNNIGTLNSNGGVILINGMSKSTNPLVLTISLGSQQVFTAQFPMSIDSITNMYRTINLINPSTVVYNTNNPSNYPDSVSNGKMVIFVHGYNVNPTQAPAWFAEGFKRLYQSGANSRFTGIFWNGAVSQYATNVPGVGGITPNYWTNVDNAFTASQSLATAVNGLSGSSKVIIAHSLGNMLVSSAINDHTMNVSQYFMLDAAMPMEAFDNSSPTFPNTNMVYTGYTQGVLWNHLSVPVEVDPGWTNYNHNLWASYWYRLFASPDGRANLTWQNRFTNVTAVNFYSSGEDVLDNAQGVFVLPGVELAWADGEMSKGTDLQGIASGLHSSSIEQGGWGISYGTNVYSGGGPIPMTNFIKMPAQTANQIPVSQLLTNPFFTHFSDTNLTGSTGSDEAKIDAVRNQTLAEAIPALSYAVGRNAFNPRVNTNNYDMVKLEDGWPQERKKTDTHNATDWFHSDSKDIAYPFTHKLWEKLVQLGNLK